ncbi:Leucine-rich repeat 1 [Paramuricea clavata]|uniref:Leucine-rich repeat 1 n=1 Tax=Paramuricea clavata TaxID=317549 RepID=A0A7D9HY52_PARCT|nr:Leucine-rich repeat 1 [Paramuricea clavata]
MRLNCDVAVQNWSSTQGLVSRRKATRASISIGLKAGRNRVTSAENDNGGTAFLLLCTANNMSGTKYKIHGNIANIFGKFVREGKATIRFKQPTHELCLSKADPPSLYKFLTTLKSSTKDNKNVKLPVLTAVKRSDVQKVKTDLMIYGTNEYLKASATFPQSLQKLSVVNCRLIRFDVRILALKHLVELNLSQNKLKELDFSLERLKLLKTLNLSSNQLTRLPSKICRTSNLVTLDLSNNELSCLPVALGAMTSLVNMRLNNNQLASLPSTIGQLTNLRSLNVGNNQLVVLPWPVSSQLWLDALDVSGNNFVSEDHYTSHNFLSETLQERAGKAIRKDRVYYNQHMIGRYLCDFLDSAKLCSTCQQWCFGCIYEIYKENLRGLAHEVTSSGQQYIPLEVYFCSSTCAYSVTV